MVLDAGSGVVKTTIELILHFAGVASRNQTCVEVNVNGFEGRMIPPRSANETTFEASMSNASSVEALCNLAV